MKRIFRGGLNWLLLFLPVAIVLEVAHARHVAWATPTWIFVAAALAIIPMAGWMGRATEHLAEHLGEGVGGLLNATFGNAAELIIAVMALIEARRNPKTMEAMHALVKASLTGSIIGNILLVMGVAMLAGGLRFSIQRFNPAGTRTSATLLMLAVAAMVIPAMFSYLIHDEQSHINELSMEISVLLLLVYGLSLVFTLSTHSYFYESDEPAEVPKEATARIVAAKPRRKETEEEHHDTWSIKKGVAVLLAATVGVAILAELMIGSVTLASEALGLTELFVGVIVVAIVGNAAEHSTAVLVALRNRMDLSLSIAIGSSIQIALFVAPVLVLLSMALGVEMDLVFTVPELVAMGIAVVVTAQIAGDGESNWLEGVLLLVVYAMLGILFFHLPA